MCRCMWLIIFSITTLIFPFSSHCEISLKTSNEEEALFIRRIIEFYQEEEYELFVNQTHEFLQTFPSSPLCADLYALLGDYYMEEKKFSEANESYKKIRDFSAQGKIVVNHLQALYCLKQYTAMAKLAEAYLDQFSETDLQKHHTILFFYAESLYRSALESNEPKEQRKAKAIKAINYYQKLLDTTLSLEAMQSLAHLYYITKKFPESADIYLKLAEKDAENKQVFLFQAATIQTKYDKEKAIQTFSQICYIGKAYSSKAAYNRMILLYDSEYYPELILAKDQFLRLIDKDKLPIVHFYLGKAHLKREDLKRAEIELKEFLKTSAFPVERKNALLSLAEIADKKEDFELFAEVLALFDPEDAEEFKEILFAHAMLCKKKKVYSQAEENLLKFLELETDLEKKQTALFEYAHTLFLNKKWSLSREFFAKFLRENVENEKVYLAWEYLLHSSYNLSIDPDEDFSNKDLCLDLQEALKQNSLQKAGELQNYRFLLAKTYYDEGSYEKALDTLKPILKKCSSRSLFTESLLMSGYCLKKMAKEPAKYISLFEKALETNPEMKEKGKVHLALFNSYIIQAKTNPESKQKAAENLYRAFLAKEILQKENLFWLADYYLKETRDFEKSIALLESITHTSNFDLSSEEREDQMIKLSRLYQENHQRDQSLAILDSLEKEYLKFPEKPWKYVQNVRYELAKEYEKLAQNDKAIMYYDDVYRNSPSLRSSIPAKACLQSARLRANFLRQKSFSKDNPEFVKILKQLKDLTIQKTLDNEPVHLEAAMEYIDLLCQLEDDKHVKQKRLSLLKNMKENFTSTDTIVDKEYHEKRLHNENKNQIFQNYMKFIENEILICKSTSPDFSEIHSAFQTLMNDPATSDFLKFRINQYLNNFQTSNVEYKGSERLDKEDE